MKYCKSIAAVLGLAISSSLSSGDTAQVPAPVKDPTLYVVGYAHLDTQWRWSYPQVIAEFLRNTMEDNFKLFDKYPHYVFNFSGSNRYGMMKEYFPEDFEKLRGYIKTGHWFPCGASMEEGDVNSPNGESIIRQVLYGNQFFRREFGVASEEFMLPDCFGFQASLPSVLSHCGLKGFSTQKLSWGSAVGIPFNVGVWEGPDGKSIVSALNCGPYDGGVDTDLSQDKRWIDRVNADKNQSGVPIDYRYYGTGDRGGAPREKSVSWVEKSATGDGPLKIVSAPADLMFRTLTAEQIAKLPRYKGDLLLTNHSCGSLSSQAFVKRTNRKLEVLGDAAERAAVLADWLGTSKYPREKLLAAWTLQLGAHFHDTMAGTALPKAYEYTWNNIILALNMFSAIAQDSVGAVTANLDTRANGLPVVVYNPLSVAREDVVEATIPSGTLALSVVSPDGKNLPFQVVSKDETGTKILFLAKVPSLSVSTFSINAETTKMGFADLRVTPRLLENDRLRVALNDAGDIASIFDKVANKEVLSSPARLEFLHENPRQYPAWNMDWEDRKQPPIGYVDGPCEFKIVENGPVRVAIETTRHARGSTITQTLRLSAGAAGNQVEVVNHVDWQTREVSLKASFPMTVSNPQATYESQSAAVKRGNNEPKKFEVPQQQWLDLTASDGSYGAAILNDCKYGSDKPSDNTVRLTLLYTPGTQGGYQDQGTQDLGRHEFTYAIAPHANSWHAGQIPWAAQRLNQPLMAFATVAHEGALGKAVSFASSDKSNVSIMAMKKAEDSDEIIVRLHETDGAATEATSIAFSSPIVSAREVDGQEREMGPAKIVDGKLVTEVGAFGLRAFAVKLQAPATVASAPVTAPVDLAYDLDAISRHANLTDGKFDDQGHTFSAEGLPAKIDSEGIPFRMGSVEDGQNNALTCHGQVIHLPAGYDRVYLLAAAVDGDAPATFNIGGEDVQQTVSDWSGYLGQWDNRIWQGVVPELTYNFTNKFAGLLPGYAKRDTVAWFSSHRHDPAKGNEYYKFTYLFKYGFDLPAGATTITLPSNEKIRVFAMTVAKGTHDAVTLLKPMYDTMKDHQYTMPAIEPVAGTFNNAITASIAPGLYGRSAEIHYTVDGTEPSAQSPVYTRPIVITTATHLRARQFQGSVGMGGEASSQFDVNDTTAPTVTSASAISVAASVSVVFSEPMDKAAAELASNYKLGADSSVTSAVLSEDGMTVKLLLSKPLQGNTQLIASGLKDMSPAGNALATTRIEVTVASPVATVDQFVADGKSSKEFTAAGLSGKGNSPWTMNMFVRPAGAMADRTLIAGFGTNEDINEGAGRFICKFSEGIHYWSRNRDVDGVAFSKGWQMITATYDGRLVTLYKDGQKLSEAALALGDDVPMVRLAPSDAWDHALRFKGDIHQFTIWPTVLKPADMATILATMPK